MIILSGIHTDNVFLIFHMYTDTPNPPVVLIFAGHDPSGAAGMQADIESISANGCRCVSIITSLTAQNTAGFAALYPQPPARLRKQARLLTTDIQVHACKLGLIGNAALIEVLGSVLRDLPAGLPMVFDPVLAAGSGEALADRALLTAMRKQLFGLTTILTPNAAEARMLTRRKDIHEAAEVLLKWGCRSVLVTGADEQTLRINNFLFSRDFETECYDWERLPGIYHGSGCTLSSSIAAQLALGLDIKAAVIRAQEFTWQALKHSYQLGDKQRHPNRFFKQR